MVVEIISRERLEKYLVKAGYDEARALNLYGWNIQISEAFFPLLNAAEVCLRNTISTRLVKLYGVRWWDDPAFLIQIKPGGKKIVKIAAVNLQKKRRLTSSGMIAQLNFGFWVQMLLTRHEQIFWQNFNTSFAHLPATTTYEDLFSRCDEVREFRNRIFHYKPIFHRDISHEYSQIMELITWLSSQKETWIKKYSRVMAVLREKPK